MAKSTIRISLEFNGITTEKGEAKCSGEKEEATEPGGKSEKQRKTTKRNGHSQLMINHGVHAAKPEGF